MVTQYNAEVNKYRDSLANFLTTFGVNEIRRKDLYRYLTGDEKALDKYLGDKEN